MVMEFKKSRIIYFIVFFITAALIFLLFVPRPVTAADGSYTLMPRIPGGPVVQSPVMRWVGVLLGLLFAQMIASVIGSSLGNREFQRLALVLLHDCDSVRFLENAAPLLKKGSRQAALVKYLMLGKAYIAEGRFADVPALCEKAEEEAKVDWITQDMRLSLCGVYANLCIALAQMGESKKAIETYSRLKSAVEATVGNRNVYESAQTLLLTTRDYIAIFVKPGFDDAAALAAHIESAATEYDRVLLHFGLARLQERLDGREAAIKSYRYAAQNGNTFACAAQARDKLKAYGVSLPA